MPRNPLDPREVGFYFMVGQVGLEMVAPVVFGLILDYSFGWMPWGTIVGAILGLFGGLAHLVSLLSRRQREDKGQPPRDGAP